MPFGRAPDQSIFPTEAAKSNRVEVAIFSFPLLMTCCIFEMGRLCGRRGERNESWELSVICPTTPPLPAWTSSRKLALAVVYPTLDSAPFAMLAFIHIFPSTALSRILVFKE